MDVLRWSIRLKNNDLRFGGYRAKPRRRRYAFTPVAKAFVLLLFLAIPVFGQLIDDSVGFCPVPASVAGCTTPNGLNGETIRIGRTSFAMEVNGSLTGMSINPWYLLVAAPVAMGGTAATPLITNSNGIFTLTLQSPSKQFFQNSSGSIYDLFGLVGDSTMNATNMFCDGNSTCATSNEISAFGKLPSYFQVFEYSVTPGVADFTPYSFSANLVNGTYLAAAGGTNPFSTPFATTGLVHNPEPVSILLLGTLAAIVFWKKKASF
jgi:hypothetical protein